MNRLRRHVDELGHLVLERHLERRRVSARRHQRRRFDHHLLLVRRARRCGRSLRGGGAGGGGEGGGGEGGGDGSNGGGGEGGGGSGAPSSVDVVVGSDTVSTVTPVNAALSESAVMPERDDVTLPASVVSATSIAKTIRAICWDGSTDSASLRCVTGPISTPEIHADATSLSEVRRLNDEPGGVTVA